MSKKILILPSQPADGDSLGSALAMYKVLSDLGKSVTVVMSADIPDVYQFLPKIEDVTKRAKVYSDFVLSIDLQGGQVNNVAHEIVDGKINIVVSPESGSLMPEMVSFPKPEKIYDLLLTVDTADLTQLGEFYTQNYMIFGEIPSINIDHHASNKNFASINLVDPNASSTTQIIYDLLTAMNVEIDADVATLLLTGVITDTGSFQNQNTTPEVFDLAAELVELGGRQQEIVRSIYKTRQLETLKLWGRILSNIQLDLDNRLVWSKVTRADFVATGTDDKDVGDIIDDLMANAEEADVVVLLTEKADGNVYGSVRTTVDELDASKIAAIFGGGGHARSAGFSIPAMTVEAVEGDVMSRIRAFRMNALGIQEPNVVPPVMDPADVTEVPPIMQEMDPANTTTSAPVDTVAEMPLNTGASETAVDESNVDQLARDFVSKPADDSTGTAQI